MNAINPLYEQIFEWQYFTDMRIGETLALRIKDIIHNSNGYFANVNGTLNYTGTKVKDYVRQPTPKTDTSFRSIKLPDKTIKIYKVRKTMTIFFKKITVGSLLQG